MGVHSFSKIALVAALAVGATHGARVIQANDDGWAELYLRSFHDALIADGHDAVISAPAENESARSMFVLVNGQAPRSCAVTWVGLPSGPENQVADEAFKARWT